MTKRKSSDSSNYKYDMYDKRPAKRRRNRNIGVAAGAGTAAVGVTRAVTAARGYSAYLPVLEEAVGGEIMADLLVPAALAGGLGAGAIAAGAALGYMAGEFVNSFGVEEDDHMMALVHAALGSPKKNKMSVPYNQGSFAVPAKFKKQKEDIYTSYGFWNVREQFGAVNGSEVVYIAANGLNMVTFSNTVALAMLRKLFRKIGKEITDAYAPLTSTNLGKAYRLLFKLDQDDGGVAFSAYDTVQDETLSTLATNSGIITSIQSYIAGGAAQSVIAEIDLCIIDNYTTTSVPPIGQELTRHLANLNLRNEKLHLHMSQSVTVQNRTKGATGTSDAVDVVDSQPLKGYLYYFKKNTPQTKMQNFTAPGHTVIWAPFQRTNLNGVMLINGTLVPDGSMRDPPTPHFFSNCAKASYVKLEPGAMKKFYVENNYFNYYTEILRKARQFSGGSSFRVQNFADTMMIALEEVLNSGSSNKITVQYEAENKVGAYFVTGPVPCISKGYQQEQISALDT